MSFANARQSKHVLTHLALDHIRIHGNVCLSPCLCAMRPSANRDKFSPAPGQNHAMFCCHENPFFLFFWVLFFRQHAKDRTHTRGRGEGSILRSRQRSVAGAAQQARLARWPRPHSVHRPGIYPFVPITSTERPAWLHSQAGGELIDVDLGT